jgi:hypothetical protein
MKQQLARPSFALAPSLLCCHCIQNNMMLIRRMVRHAWAARSCVDAGGVRCFAPAGRSALAYRSVIARTLPYHRSSTACYSQHNDNEAPPLIHGVLDNQPVASDAPPFPEAMRSDTTDIFDRALKQTHKNRAAASSSASDYHYLLSDIGNVLIDRVSDIRDRSFETVADIGCGFSDDNLEQMIPIIPGLKQFVHVGSSGTCGL